MILKGTTFLPTFDTGGVNAPYCISLHVLLELRKDPGKLFGYVTSAAAIPSNF